MKIFIAFFVFVFSATFPSYAEKSKTVQNYFKIALSDSSFKPGETLTVFVDSANRLKDIELECFGRRQSIYRVWHEKSDHLFRAFAGIPHSLKPGTYAVVARATDFNGRKLEIYADIHVADARFKVQNIRVPKGKKNLLRAKILQKEAETIKGKLSIRDQKVYFVSDFAMPVKGRKTSSFGVRRRYDNGDVSSYHRGVDIANKRGTIVRASNGGRVSLAARLKSHGNTVLINHGHGIATIYCHLDRILVKQGAWVKKRGIIGRVGSTGLSNGPHLHFGVSVDNVRVDPEMWIKGRVKLHYQNLVGKD